MLVGNLNTSDLNDFEIPVLISKGGLDKHVLVDRGGFRGSANTRVEEQKDYYLLEKKNKKLPSHPPSQMFADSLNPHWVDKHMCESEREQKRNYSLN